MPPRSATCVVNMSPVSIVGDRAAPRRRPTEDRRARSRFFRRVHRSAGASDHRWLNRDAEHDIQHALPGFEARPAPLARPVAPGSGRSASGARPRGCIRRHRGGDPAGAAAGRQTLTRETVIRLVIVAAFVALGARSVTVVAAPPLDAHCAWGSPASLRIARELGAAFALLRFGPLIMLGRVARRLHRDRLPAQGSQPAADRADRACGLLTARFTAPDPANPDRDALRRQLTARLDAELRPTPVSGRRLRPLVLKRDDFSAHPPLICARSPTSALAGGPHSERRYPAGHRAASRPALRSRRGASARLNLRVHLEIRACV